jgi:septum formation protein
VIRACSHNEYQRRCETKLCEQALVSGVPMLILASASPRRTELLRQIGMPHRVLPADIDERRLTGEGIEQCVQRLARSKASQVWQQLPQRSDDVAVLGADTVVVIDDALLGKPRDRDDAMGMLQRLAGRTHRVLSAIALATARGLDHAMSVSEVRFRTLSHAECAAYWDTGEPHDKAGSYAIQGQGALFIECLTGSYSGVMGLPLFETGQLLSAAGFAPLPPGVAP